MIGSVVGSRRATAFAQALDERDAAEATAGEQAADEDLCRAVPHPVRPPGHLDRGPGPRGGAPGTGADGSEPDDRSERRNGTDSRAHPRPWADGGTEQSLLLAVVDGLAQLPKPGLSSRTKEVQRTRLMAAMESAVATDTAGSNGTAPEPAPGSAQPGAREVPEAAVVPETVVVPEVAEVPEQRTAPPWRRPVRGRTPGSHRAPGLGPLGRLRPKSRLSKGLVAGGLGIGVAASALGGVAAASTNALPGDSLYDLKRGMEDLRLDLASDDADRGELHLDHASTRLHEARRLMERDRSGTLDHESLGEIRKALSAVRDDATEGHRLLSTAYEQGGGIAPMRSLSSFSEEHRDGWSHLRDRLPAQLSDVRDKISSVFDAIDSDVSPLKGRLSDGSPAARTDRGGARGPQGDGPSSHGPSRSGSGSEPDDGHDGDRGGPAPSDAQPRHGGLLQDGGLLDPPADSHGSGKPSGHGHQGQSQDQDHTPPDPDVTLPPIVPEVLPGVDGLPTEGDR